MANKKRKMSFGSNILVKAITKPFRQSLGSSETPVMISYLPTTSKSDISYLPTTSADPQSYLPTSADERSSIPTSSDAQLSELQTQFAQSTFFTRHEECQHTKATSFPEVPPDEKKAKLKQESHEIYLHDSEKRYNTEKTLFINNPPEQYDCGHLVDTTKNPTTGISSKSEVDATKYPTMGTSPKSEMDIGKYLTMGISPKTKVKSTNSTKNNLEFPETDTKLTKKESSGLRLRLSPRFRAKLSPARLSTPPPQTPQFGDYAQQSAAPAYATLRHRKAIRRPKTHLYADRRKSLEFEDYDCASLRSLPEPIREQHFERPPMAAEKLSKRARNLRRSDTHQSVRARYEEDWPITEAGAEDEAANGGSDAELFGSPRRKINQRRDNKGRTSSPADGMFK